MTEVASNPAVLLPGQFPPVPASQDELLIEALRFSNRVSVLLNDLRDNIFERIESNDDHRFDDLCEMLLRQHSDCSALHLFIAASNLRIPLPPDLQSEPDDDE